MKVGDKVAAIIDDPSGDFKKGDVFIVYGIRVSNCKCACNEINIGLNDSVLGYTCLTCKEIVVTGDKIYWQDERDFRKIDTRPELSELTDEMILTAPAIKELQTA